MYSLLIVDDEREERDGVEFFIRRRAFPITLRKASNGREALRLLEEGPADILLTDIKMPLMNGLELCAAAREKYPAIVLIILSAYGDYEYTRRAIQVRVDDYILKPVAAEDFCRAIENAVRLLDDRRRQSSSAFVKAVETVGSSEYRRQRLQEDGAACDAQERRIVAEVLRLVEEHYQQDIGLEWVAQKVGLSAGYLSGLFKQAVGKGFIQVLTTYRMEKARQLLVDSNLRIAEICAAVGYNNPSYFCLLFKKYFGVTANQMRERGGRT